MSKCNGDCCRRFTLPLSMDDFKRALQARTEYEAAYIDGQPPLKPHDFEWRDEYGQVHSPLICQDRAELEYIIDMLIPLGKHLAHSCHMDTPYKSDEWAEHRGHVHHYTCKHFNTETKRCTAYETRPHFCRSFGEGNQSCGYEGCEQEKHRVAECEARWKREGEELRKKDKTCRLKSASKSTETSASDPCSSTSAPEQTSPPLGGCSAGS